MDHVGFDAFYRNEHSRVLGVVVALTGRADLARDASDEAFARALARWARVSKMESPTSPTGGTVSLYASSDGGRTWYVRSTSA